MERGLSKRRNPGLAADRMVAYMAMFLVGVIFVLIASNGWLAWRSFQTQDDIARRSTGNLSHAVARQVDGLFSEIERAIDAVVFELERGDLSQDAIDGLQPSLVGLISRTDHLDGLFVLNKSGFVSISTFPERPSTINNADRQYFAFHLNNPSATTLIGSPIVSRASGAWVVPLSRRVNDYDGSFAGEVLATVRIDYLLSLVSDFDVGLHGAVALSHRDGPLLVRKPFAVEDFGRSMLQTSVYQQLAKMNKGIVTLISPIDNVKRVVGFETTKNHPLVIAVARSEDELFGDWRKAVAIQAATVVLVIAFIAFFGRYLLILMSGRVKDQAKLKDAHHQVIAANTQLLHLAEHDDLTQILNRRAFDARLEELFNASKHIGRPISLVLFDVDFFKNFNDHFGHQAGDYCLRQVASALRESARRSADYAARYGGEEFALILPDTDIAGASLIALTVLDRVRALRIGHPTSKFGVVTLSAGIASAFEHPRLSETPFQLIANADSALYQAKELGRDRLAVFDPRAADIS